MIHRTALIDPKASISKNVKIGPFSIIGPNVEIGEDTEIQSHVSIVGYTTIGKNNKVYPYASIGNDPQDMKFKGEKTELIIGDNNTIREYATINPGTFQGGGKTVIGNKNLIMIGAHIAHDCILGNQIIIANNAAIAGHAVIDDNVVLGGNCGVHQFTRIGKMAMVGGMTGVSRDIIPYAMSTGNRNVLNGINLVGLRRLNISNQKIMSLNDAYKIMFSSNNLGENLKKLTLDLKKNELVKEVIDFINKDKKRPICTPEIN